MVGQVDVGALLLLGEEVGYLVVLGVVVWEGVREVEGLVEGQEEGLVEGQGAGLVEVQEEEDEALDPSGLQVYQEASRMEEHLAVGQEAGQRVDQEASLEELGVDPVVEAQPLADLASVEALAVPLAHQEGVDVGGIGCHLAVPCPRCPSCLIHLCIPPLPLLLPPLQE